MLNVRSKMLDPDPNSCRKLQFYNPAFTLAKALIKSCLHAQSVFFVNKSKTYTSVWLVLNLHRTESSIIEKFIYNWLMNWNAKNLKQQSACYFYLNYIKTVHDNKCRCGKKCKAILNKLSNLRGIQMNKTSIQMKHMHNMPTIWFV